MGVITDEKALGRSEDVDVDAIMEEAARDDRVEMKDIGMDYKAERARPDIHRETNPTKNKKGHPRLLNWPESVVLA